MLSSLTRSKFTAGKTFRSASGVYQTRWVMLRYSSIVLFFVGMGLLAAYAASGPSISTPVRSRAPLVAPAYRVVWASYHVDNFQLRGACGELFVRGRQRNVQCRCECDITRIIHGNPETACEFQTGFVFVCSQTIGFNPKI
jgi:hypothetical protein